MVKEVHESFTDEQKNKEWTKEIEEGESKGLTPLCMLLISLQKKPDDRDLLKMIKTVAGSLFDQTHTLSTKELEVELEQNHIRFHLLLNALKKYPYSERLLELVKEAHEGFTDKQKNKDNHTWLMTLLLTLNKNPFSDKLIELVEGAHESLTDNQRKTVWIKEMDARKWKGVTPFCILLIALRKNPLSNKLWAFIKTIHEIFSAQTMIPWTNEIQQKGDWYEKTPFSILLHLLIIHPKSNDFYFMVKKVHESFTDKQKNKDNHTWLMTLLLELLNKNPHSETVLEMVKEAHENLTDNQRKILWIKEIDAGDAKGITPFYVLLRALINNPESADLLKMVEKVHKSLGNDTKKTAWLKKREAGHHKGKTPFSFLRAASHNHSDSNQLSELFETVQQNLGNDANTACLNEIVNDFGATNI